MLVRVPGLLDREQLAHVRAVLEKTAWVDGRATAGEQSAKAKFNLQVPEDAPEARELGQLILGLLGRNETFVSAALPLIWAYGSNGAAAASAIGYGCGTVVAWLMFRRLSRTTLST